jgi:CBS domain-containing protein
MQLKDVMKKQVEVVEPDTSLCEAARKMSAHNVSMLPVCDGRRVVGLLTVRDLTIRATSQGCDPHTGRVREVMMLPAVYGREDQEISQALDLMQRWQLHRLPVLDRRRRLVGMVSLRDLCRGNGSGATRRPVSIESLYAP